ncbi:MAG: hypothetical protein ACR2NA_13870 [Solirubrobacterales bacterium]
MSDRILNGLDLAIDFATLGEYGLDRGAQALPAAAPHLRLMGSDVPLVDPVRADADVVAGPWPGSATCATPVHRRVPPRRVGAPAPTVSPVTAGARRLQSASELRRGGAECPPAPAGRHLSPAAGFGHAPSGTVEGRCNSQLVDDATRQRALGAAAGEQLSFELIA